MNHQYQQKSECRSLKLGKIDALTESYPSIYTQTRPCQRSHRLTNHTKVSGIMRGCQIYLQVQLSMSKCILVAHILGCTATNFHGLLFCIIVTSFFFFCNLNILLLLHFRKNQRNKRTSENHNGHKKQKEEEDIDSLRIQQQRNTQVCQVMGICSQQRTKQMHMGIHISQQCVNMILLFKWVGSNFNFAYFVHITFPNFAYFVHIAFYI